MAHDTRRQWLDRSRSADLVCLLIKLLATILAQTLARRVALHATDMQSFVHIVIDVKA